MLFLINFKIVVFMAVIYLMESFKTREGRCISTTKYWFEDMMREESSKPKKENVLILQNYWFEDMIHLLGRCETWMKPSDLEERKRIREIYTNKIYITKLRRNWNSNSGSIVIFSVTFVLKGSFPVALFRVF